MITNFWSKTKVFCSCDNTREMALVLHGNTPTYECPVCHKGFSCYEFEKMINHFQNIIVNGAKQDEEINLTNCLWRNKTATYKVLLHNSEGLKVEVNLNK